jgi:lambda family phage portal protein
MRLPALLGRLIGREAPPLRTRTTWDTLPLRAEGRRWAGNPGFGPINGEVLANAHADGRRALGFARRNPHAVAGVAAIVTSTIGYGARPASQHSDPATRAAIGTAWNTWAGKADADGVLPIEGLQAQLVQSMVEYGDGVARLIDTPDGLRIQALPPDLLDLADTRELGGGARIIAGVELDSSGRRVAYHIRPSNPAAAWDTYAPAVRVPAEDVVHLYKPLSPGMVRGMSWLTPVLELLNEHDQYSDAALTAAKTQALLCGFIIDQNSPIGAPVFDGTQTGGTLDVSLEPGVMRTLGPGQDVRFSNPAAMQQGAEFARSQLRAIAAGLGVPEHLLTGDVSQANYSSLRAATAAFKQRIEAIQYGIVAHQLLRPVYRRFVLSLVLRGEIDAPGFEENPEPYLSAEWHFPPMPGIDPSKDADATSAMLAAGLMSRRMAVAQQGLSIEDLDREIAADRAREAALGLAFGVPAKAPADGT